MIIEIRRLLVLSGLVVVSPNLSAADVPSEFLDCRKLASSIDRLDCYDALVDANARIVAGQAKDEARESHPSVATIPPTGPSDPALKQEDMFGQDASNIRKSVQETTGEKEFERIEATIVRVRHMASGKTVVTLDNGQVWQQIEPKRTRLSENDEVTIRRRSLGSFTLYNKKTAIRVKRIR
jgi:hypothetical protein